MADKSSEKVKRIAKKASQRGAEIKAKGAEIKARGAEIKAIRNGNAVPKVNSGQLELLVSIVPSNKTEFYTDLLQSSFEVNFQWTARAHGTADAEMLKLSEWSDQTKTAIFSVIKKEHATDALAALDERFKTIKRGKGIAFTVPFTSMIGVAAYGFLSNNLKTVKEEKNG